MENYTIYCTTEQTKKALELGAPIEFKTLCHYDLQDGKFIPYPDLDIDINGDPILIPPTVEQMIGWLEKNTLFKCIQVNIDANPTNWMYAIYYGKDNCIALDRFSSRKDATLAAIDAALDYLIHYKNGE